MTDKVNEVHEVENNRMLILSAQAKLQAAGYEAYESESRVPRLIVRGGPLNHTISLAILEGRVSAERINYLLNLASRQ
jgi:hypothetical protein